MNRSLAIWNLVFHRRCKSSFSVFLFFMRVTNLHESNELCRECKQRTPWLPLWKWLYLSQYVRCFSNSHFNNRCFQIWKMISCVDIAIPTFCSPSSSLGEELCYHKPFPPWLCSAAPHTPSPLWQCCLWKTPASLLGVELAGGQAWSVVGKEQDLQQPVAFLLLLGFVLEWGWHLARASTAYSWSTGARSSPVPLGHGAGWPACLLGPRAPWESGPALEVLPWMLDEQVANAPQNSFPWSRIGRTAQNTRSPW